MKFGEPKSVDDKIDAYLKFWNLEETPYPIIGFDVGGFFPFQWFGALRELGENVWLEPEHLEVSKYLDDYTSVYKRASSVNDDFIKGVSPIPAIPWMEAILGCPVEISGESIWGRERNADWKELEGLSLKENNPWLKKYLEFLEALVGNAQGEYPISQPILRGITDLVGGTAWKQSSPDRYHGSAGQGEKPGGGMHRSAYPGDSKTIRDYPAFSQRVSHRTVLHVVAGYHRTTAGGSIRGLLPANIR